MIAPPRPAALHAVQTPPAPEPRHVVPVTGLLLSSAAPGSPESRLAAEARLAVRAALEDLPAADRLLVELRVFHGWSIGEIAQLAAGDVDDVGERLESVLLRLGLDPGAVLPDTDADAHAGSVSAEIHDQEVVA